MHPNLCIDALPSHCRDAAEPWLRCDGVQRCWSLPVQLYILSISVPLCSCFWPQYPQLVCACAKLQGNRRRSANAVFGGIAQLYLHAHVSWTVGLIPSAQAICCKLACRLQIQEKCTALQLCLPFAAGLPSSSTCTWHN